MVKILLDSYDTDNVVKIEKGETWVTNGGILYIYDATKQLVATFVSWVGVIK